MMQEGIMMVEGGVVPEGGSFGCPAGAKTWGLGHCPTWFRTPKHARTCVVTLTLIFEAW